jgi:hypothetical protein
MEANTLLFKKYEKPSQTWGKIKKEITHDFHFLPEQDRIELLFLWDKLTRTKDFQIRKMNNDTSSDKTIYFDLEDHLIKKLEKIRLGLGN